MRDPAVAGRRRNHICGKRQAATCAACDISTGSIRHNGTLPTPGSGPAGSSVHSKNPVRQLVTTRVVVIQELKVAAETRTRRGPLMKLRSGPVHNLLSKGIRIATQPGSQLTKYLERVTDPIANDRNILGDVGDGAQCFRRGLRVTGVPLEQRSADR